MEAADDVVVLDFADEQSVVQTRFATTALTLLRAHLGLHTDAVVADARTALADAAARRARRAATQFTFLGRGWSVGPRERGRAQDARGRRCRGPRPTRRWSTGTGPSASPPAAPSPGCSARRPRGWPNRCAATGALWVGGRLDPLAELVRAQRLAVAVAAARGLDPDRPRHLTRSVILDRTARLSRLEPSEPSEKEESCPSQQPVNWSPRRPRRVPRSPRSTSSPWSTSRPSSPGAEAADAPVILQVSENAVKFRDGRLLPLARAAAAAAERASRTRRAAPRPRPERRAAAAGGRRRLQLRDVRRRPAAVRTRTSPPPGPPPTGRTPKGCGSRPSWARSAARTAQPPLDAHAPGARTDPGEARAFVADSGVDALAVAIGSSHAMTTRTAALDHDLLKRSRRGPRRAARPARLLRCAGRRAGGSRRGRHRQGQRRHGPEHRDDRRHPGVPHRPSRGGRLPQVPRAWGGRRWRGRWPGLIRVLGTAG